MPRGVYQRAGAMPAERIEDTKIEQHDDIVSDTNEHPSEIVRAERIDAAPEVHSGSHMMMVDGKEVVLSKEYLDDLAFNDEKVTIRLEPSGQENAPDTFGFVGVNGKPAEIWMNGGWHECGYLPIDTPFITKRKYLAVILSAKVDIVRTTEIQPEEVFIGMRPSGNKIKRTTSQAISVSIIEDRNPRGADWIRELRRRNM